MEMKFLSKIDTKISWVRKNDEMLELRKRKFRF
jgi:hypothetical protein